MNAEFNWWLLIVGLVLGAALTWLVMAESARRDADVSETERRGEALWIASMLSSAGRPIDGASVEEILRLHREYLSAPMPDEPDPAVTGPPAEPASTPVSRPDVETDPDVVTSRPVAGDRSGPPG